VPRAGGSGAGGGPYVAAVRAPQVAPYAAPYAAHLRRRAHRADWKWTNLAFRAQHRAL